MGIAFGYVLSVAILYAYFIERIRLLIVLIDS